MRKYRKPSALPKLRRLPKVGELLYIQDLDGSIIPVTVLEVFNDKRLKTPNLVKVLIEGRTSNIYISELRILNR